MNCRNCGAEVIQGEKFCWNCGAPFRPPEFWAGDGWGIDVQPVPPAVERFSQEVRPDEKPDQASVVPAVGKKTGPKITLTDLFEEIVISLAGRSF